MMVKIVFFGTSKFAKIILQKLIESGYKPILVVTQPDRPAGRKQILAPSPVKIIAEKHDIPVVQPETLKGFNPYKLVGVKPLQLQIDLFITAAYGKIIPKAVLDAPKYGALNIHPSLLPKWRGPSPIQYAILNGDEITGVTIMLMDEKLDHGPILANSQFSILNSQLTSDELSKKLAKISAELLVETIPEWILGKIKPREQNHKEATYSKHINKSDGHIDWRKSAEEIERMLRAFTPWPGIFSFWKDKRINIKSVYVSETPATNTPGKVSPFDNGEIAVNTSNKMIVIKALQLDGKKEIAGKEFLNGHKDILGDTLR